MSKTKYLVSVKTRQGELLQMVTYFSKIPTEQEILDFVTKEDCVILFMQVLGGRP